MNISTLYEITSDDQMLTSLGLAIAEAKMTRSLVRSKVRSFRRFDNDPYAKRLMHLDYEIDYLEAKLSAVRSKANRG